MTVAAPRNQIRRVRKYTKPPTNLSDKLCDCGCGEFTRIAQFTIPKYGNVRGQPNRFVNGHHRRIKDNYRVDKKTGCWIWTGWIEEKGYGRTTRNCWPMYAHRFIWEKLRGPLPEEMELDHIDGVCSSKACVNPDHLEPVTHAENVRRYLRWKAEQI